MRYLILILVLFCCEVGYSHDANLAVFEVSQDDGQFKLAINLDILDLQKSILTAYPELQDQGVEQFKGCIVEYIQNNFQLTIDGECQEWTVDSLKFDKNYSRLYASLPFKGEPKVFEVYNTCLIDYNEGHVNLFKSTLYDRVRTFKMSAERIATKVTYD